MLKCKYCKIKLEKARSIVYVCKTPLGFNYEYIDNDYFCPKCSNVIKRSSSKNKGIMSLDNKYIKNLMSEYKEKDIVNFIKIYKNLFYKIKRNRKDKKLFNHEIVQAMGNYIIKV